MEKKKYLWLGVAAMAGVALLGVGGWRLVNWPSLESTPPTEEKVAETETVKIPTPVEVMPEESEVVLDETRTTSGELHKSLEGVLVSVSGRTMVLEWQGDRLQVDVSPEATIIRTVVSDVPGEIPQRAEVTFSDLQPGDKINALVKIEGNKATATNVNVIVGPQ